jgi:hypothetical protein
MGDKWKGLKAEDGRDTQVARLLTVVTKELEAQAQESAYTSIAQLVQGGLTRATEADAHRLDEIKTIRTAIESLKIDPSPIGDAVKESLTEVASALRTLEMQAPVVEGPRVTVRLDEVAQAITAAVTKIDQAAGRMEAATRAVAKAIEASRNRTITVRREGGQVVVESR